jgi:hypothetical protein
MAALVLHYDQSETNVCEATGLVNLNSTFERLLERGAAAAAAAGAGAGPAHDPKLCLALGQGKVVILVSPTFYHQRKRFYGDGGDKFRWAALDAVQIKKLMRINESDNQLYVGVMLAKLRGYQRVRGVPEFQSFCKEIMDACCSQPGKAAR